MKYLPFIFSSLILLSLNAFSETRLIARCEHVIDSNVSHSALQPLRYANIRILRNDGKDSGYVLDADNTAPFGLLLDGACLDQPVKGFYLKKCLDASNSLVVKTQYSGGDNERTIGKYDKRTRRLQIINQSQKLLFYHTNINALLQCH